MLGKQNIKLLVLISITIIVLLLAIINISIRTHAFDNNLIIKLKIQGTNQTSNNKFAKITIYNQAQAVQENSDISLIKQTDNSYQADIPLNLTNFTSQYAVFIKPNRTIGKLICNNLLTLCQSPELFFQKGINHLDITNTLFYVGDIDQNGFINEADSSLMLKYLGKNNKEAIHYADLNSDEVVDSQDYALLIYALYQNQTDPQINFFQQPTPTPIPPTITPTPIGICHAIKPDLSGGGAYDLENGSYSPCTCTLGVCAQAMCNGCVSGICDCGSVPLQMPPTEMNCSNGATFTIQICTP